MHGAMARASRAGPGAGGCVDVFSICDALGVTTRRAAPPARASSCMRCMCGAPQRESGTALTRYRRHNN